MMANSESLSDTLSASSALEDAFLRYVLDPALDVRARPFIAAQHAVEWDEHTYRLDYALMGERLRIAIELDGFAFHGNRDAFTYDRLRQNDLQALGWSILRFSYDAIRTDTERCVAQLQILCR